MASLTRLERDSTLPLGTATVQRLERLAGTLEERGMCVTLVAPPSRFPRLQVAHPSPDGAIGDIYASRGRDGNWWFWWPWASGSAQRATWRPLRPGSRKRSPGPPEADDAVDGPGRACNESVSGVRGESVSGARGPGRRWGL